MSDLLLYRVVHTTEFCERFEDREFLADLKDAWQLWYWLTTMASEEPERRERAVRDRRATLLSALGPLPSIVVRVFDISGHEVCPEHGFPGMREYKPPAATKSTGD